MPDAHRFSFEENDIVYFDSSLSRKVRKAYIVFVERLIAAHYRMTWEEAERNYPFLTFDVWDAALKDLGQFDEYSNGVWYDEDIRKQYSEDWRFMSELAEGRLPYIRPTEDLTNVLELVWVEGQPLVYGYQRVLEMFLSPAYLRSGDPAIDFKEITKPVMESIGEYYRHRFELVIKAEQHAELVYEGLYRFLSFLLDEYHFPQLLEVFNSETTRVMGTTVKKALSEISVSDKALVKIECPLEVDLSWLYFALMRKGIVIDSVQAKRKTLVCHNPTEVGIRGDELVKQVKLWLANIKADRLPLGTTLSTFVGELLFVEDLRQILTYSDNLMKAFGFIEMDDRFHLTGMYGEVPDIRLSTDRKYYYGL